MGDPNKKWHKIPLGLCNAYLIEGREGAVLVDAGQRHCEGLLFRMLERHRIPPEQIRLIVITHAHFDHVGGLRKIRDICRCPVAIHPLDAALIRRGQMVFPPGTNPFGKAASSLGRLLGKLLVRYDPVEADILVSEEMELEPFGVTGTIIPTPGHTHGSLSVCLPDGDTFVGDTAANLFPGNTGPILPPFAQDVAKLLESWRVILQRGARLICPGHGRPFEADRLPGEMDRISNRSIKKH